MRLVLRVCPNHAHVPNQEALFCDLCNTRLEVKQFCDFEEVQDEIETALQQRK